VVNTHPGGQTCQIAFILDNLEIATIVGEDDDYGYSD
jgi:hypothetical protein